MFPTLSPLCLLSSSVFTFVRFSCPSFLLMYVYLTWEHHSIFIKTYWSLLEFLGEMFCGVLWIFGGCFLFHCQIQALGKQHVFRLVCAYEFVSALSKAVHSDWAPRKGKSLSVTESLVPGCMQVLTAFLHHRLWHLPFLKLLNYLTVHTQELAGKNK